MEAALQELRYAARRLARPPAFTMMALGTLALAIGASTAAFSLVNGVLLKPLGFARQDRLVYLHGTDARDAATMLSPQDLIDFRNETHSFTAVAAVESRQNLNLLRPHASPLRVNAARVGAEFFEVLGIRARIGRSVSLMLPGLLAGIVGAVFLTRTIRGLLFGIEPLDRPTLALVCLVFAGVGGIASWLPARRVAGVDPIIAMCSE
jgi:hypothetical protein